MISAIVVSAVMAILGAVAAAVRHLVARQVARAARPGLTALPP